MENNITAVQFIKEQIELNSDTSFFNIDWDKFDEIIEQAKEMEKQQIIAFLKWVGDGYDFQNNAKEIVNEYYNETFKSE